MKSVLISIQPKWCELIANGEKTIEVRKTKPKLPTPFKCYIYCTQNKEKLIDVIHGGDDMGDFIHKGKPNFIKGYADGWSLFGVFRGGKIIGEFVCDDIGKFKVFENGSVQNWVYHNLELSCLTYEGIANYIGRDKNGYGWHISDLVIYDKPKELTEFVTVCEGLRPRQCDKCEYSYSENTESGSYSECCCNNLKPLKRPPQSWCYVYGKGEGE